MFSQVFYLVRSKIDGQYLAAHPNSPRRNSPDSDAETSANPAYLLLFKEHFDALSYLNTHGAEVADQFAVESMAGSQLGSLMKRWGFTGIGLVQDPLLPQVDFMRQDS